MTKYYSYLRNEGYWKKNVWLIQKENKIHKSSFRLCSTFEQNIKKVFFFHGWVEALGIFLFCFYEGVESISDKMGSLCICWSQGWLADFSSKMKQIILAGKS